MSYGCGGACGGAFGGGGPGGAPPAWRQTTVDEGVPRGGCGGGAGAGGQPGRAPASMRDHSCPWWVWIVVAIAAWQVLKGAA